MAHKVTLTWDAPVGSVVTSYNVKRGSSATGAFTTIGTANITSYIDNNVAEGDTWFYEITAVNTAGEGQPSVVASATIPFSIPGAPTNLVAVAS